MFDKLDKNELVIIKICKGHYNELFPKYSIEKLIKLFYQHIIYQHDKPIDTWRIIFNIRSLILKIKDIKSIEHWEEKSKEIFIKSNEDYYFWKEESFEDIVLTKHLFEIMKTEIKFNLTTDLEKIQKLREVLIQNHFRD